MYNKLILFLVFSFCFFSCKKEEGVVSLRINDSSGQFISSTFTCPNGMTANVELWFGSGNFWLNESMNGCNCEAQIVDVGKIRKLSKIDEIPSTGWTGILSAQEEHGYIIRYKDNSGNFKYLKFYVEEAVTYGYCLLQIKDPF